jgi:HK97 family phage prohead protease
MPKPKPGETEKDFVSRFMADQAMGVEFPDEKQRAAVAHAEWKRKKKEVDEAGLSTVEGIFESLGKRITFGRWGIGTALQYVKTVDAVFAAGLANPTTAFELTPAVWQKELESAARRLTYCDESSGDTDFITKSVREGADIARGAILEYDCILSTRRKDRDGDIVEPGGMDVDQKMPLLWQHVQSQPIGKHLSVVQQDENRVVCKFAIADIPLGRDAATLVKFGALRKSHGFKPVPGEFEPLEIVKQADGKQVAKGWHIRKSHVMEGSLVSIPANADANVLAVYEKSFDGLCTAFSRDLLHTDAVKHWAKSLYDRRPVVVQGADMKTKTVLETISSYEFPGSFEFIREHLQRSLAPMGPVDPRNDFHYIAATFADTVIYCSRRFDEGSSSVKCYRQSYETKDGIPTFTGTPTEITVTPTIMEKLMADLQTKGMVPVTTISGVDSTGKQGQAIDGGALPHNADRKRCPKCGKADLDSTNSCKVCGFIDHTNTTKPDTQPASNASENPGGKLMDVGKAADSADIATKCSGSGGCGEGGKGDGKGSGKPAGKASGGKCAKCGGSMGDDGKCSKCGATEYAKAYTPEELREISAADLARLLMAKAVSGDPAAASAVEQIKTFSAVVVADTQQDPLAELFAE